MRFPHVQPLISYPATSQGVNQDGVLSDVLPLFVTLTRTRFLCEFCRKAFDGIDDDARRHIFKEPLAAVVQVLEQNLLGKFRTRTMLQVGALTYECMHTK